MEKPKRWRKPALTTAVSSAENAGEKKVRELEVVLWAWVVLRERRVRRRGDEAKRRSE